MIDNAAHVSHIAGNGFSDAVDVPGLDPASIDDRRVETRQITILRIAKISSESNVQFCLVRNISSGGLMADLALPIREGEKVSVEINGGEALYGSVMWINGQAIGIGFDLPVSLDRVLSKHGSILARRTPRPPRLEVDMPAKLWIEHRGHAVQSIDISAGGAKLRFAGQAARDDLVSILIPGLKRIEGSIRWVKNGLVGIAFNQKLRFAELAEWQAQHHGQHQN